MKNILLSLALAAIATGFVTMPASASSAEVGKSAPDFTLTDIDGTSHQLSSLRGKTVVLEWVNPECPFVVKHYGSGNIPRLQKAASVDGVVWLSINSAASGKQGDYDPTKAKAWINQNGAAATAYLRDSDGKVGKLYGAKTTPHIFVINGEGTLVYDGAIDSIRSTEVDDIPKATNYVTAALTSLKAGGKIEKTNTTPYGCSVKY